MALWSTQPLTEMSTRNLLGGKGRPVLKVDNLTVISADCLENVGDSTSHKTVIGIVFFIFIKISEK
jgi:hypothetical protein